MNRPGPLGLIEELAALGWTAAAAWMALPGGPSFGAVTIAALGVTALALGARAHRRVPLSRLLAAGPAPRSPGSIPAE